MAIRSRVRLRTRSGQRSVGYDPEAEVKEMLDEYRELEQRLEEAQMAVRQLESKISSTMASGKLTQVFHEMYEAKYVPPATRSTTTIDPQKFSDSVTPEEFWECVTISVTRAREVLSERELKKVATVTEGEVKPPVLTIKKVKKAK